MTKAEKRRTLMHYRDMLKGRKAKEDDTELYEKFYEDLGKAECLDADYSDNMKKGEFDKAISKVEDFSLQDCIAYLTFVMRAERWSNGWFAKSIDDGSIYNLLKRAVDVMP